MIVVDSNVVSEFGNHRPNPRVVEWLANQGDRLFLPTIVLGELMFGVERMAEGRRKVGMRRLYADLIAGFQDRILSFDRAAAFAYAELMALTEAKGRTMPETDGFIAAIAKTHSAAVATRNTRHFEAAGLTIINPWEDK
jgi:hypothetical protein